MSFKEILINKKGDLTRLLDKLVKMKYVDRYINDENRRMVNLKITEKISSEIINLPCHPYMSQKEITKISKNILDLI